MSLSRKSKVLVEQEGLMEEAFIKYGFVQEDQWQAPDEIYPEKFAETLRYRAGKSDIPIPSSHAIGNFLRRKGYDLVQTRVWKDLEYV